MNIILWIGKNLATILGIAQGVVKIAKEVLTGIVNIFFPLFPDDGKFEQTVNAIREFVNKIDAWIEGIKQVVLGNG